MNALVFLAIAVGLSAVGCIVLWIRHRQPSSMESGIDAFQREMTALSPSRETPSRRRSRSK